MSTSSQNPVERKTPQELAIELMTTTQLMTNGETDARRLLDSLRDEALGEVFAWLVKKAREFQAAGQTVQADTASILASKVARGAVRPDNLRMLPEPEAGSILDRARDALNARMTKDTLRHVLSNVIAYAARLEAEREQAHRGETGGVR
ncbi:hypothetical protein ACPC36_07830 [Streptomyces pseudogriseolus]|uniref:hypothetical protein n=1 Tax=Streptomyces pseudogriseolus TaxID=36817 RepID=UPI003FA1E29B